MQEINKRIIYLNDCLQDLKLQLKNLGEEEEFEFTVSGGMTKRAKIKSEINKLEFAINELYNVLSILKESN